MAASKRKIVLVDDNPQILNATARYLRGRELEVVTSESALGVNALILDHKPQAVVLDVMMPALGGGELARIIRGRAQVAIIFYSAMPEEDLYRLTKQVPGSTYVLKSDGAEILLAAIEKALSRPG
jgi:DNA-binding response OmpR family regulator